MTASNLKINRQIILSHLTAQIIPAGFGPMEATRRERLFTQMMETRPTAIPLVAGLLTSLIYALPRDDGYRETRGDTEPTDGLDYSLVGWESVSKRPYLQQGGMQISTPQFEEMDIFESLVQGIHDLPKFTRGRTAATHLAGLVHRLWAYGVHPVSMMEVAFTAIELPRKHQNEDTFYRLGHSIQPVDPPILLINRESEPKWPPRTPLYILTVMVDCKLSHITP